MSKIIVSILLIVIFDVNLLYSWNLSHLNLTADNYAVRHVSVLYVRAFLCVTTTTSNRISHQQHPSSSSALISNSEKHNIKNQLKIISKHFTHIGPTLVETTWPENLLPIKPRIFPDTMSHAKHPTDCTGIQEAIETAMDVGNHQLWVLDNGSQYCQPKLIAYQLSRRNDEIHRYNFKNFHGHSFSSLRIAPSLGAGAPNKTRIFLTLYDQDFLVVYSAVEHNWWKLRLL